MQFAERSQEFLTYFLFKSQWNVVSEQKLDNMLMVHGHPITGHPGLFHFVAPLGMTRPSPISGAGGRTR
jgi:hypothetical protein